MHDGEQAHLLALFRSTVPLASGVVLVDGAGACVASDTPDAEAIASEARFGPGCSAFVERAGGPVLVVRMA